MPLLPNDVGAGGGGLLERGGLDITHLGKTSGGIYVLIYIMDALQKHQLIVS